MVSAPTRDRVNQKPSLLDLVLTNDNNLITKLDHLSPLGSSDHCVLRFSIKCYKDINVYNALKRDYYKGNYEAMKEQLDVLEKEKFFMRHLNCAIEKHVPIKRVRKKGATPLGPEAVNSIRRKHRAWTTYYESRDATHYREYCKARNKVKSMIKKDRKVRERRIAETSKSNSKNFWSYVNSKRKTKSGIGELHTQKDGKTCIASTDLDKAEVLGEFFTSVFTMEDNHDYPPVKECEVNKPFSDTHFSVEDVNKLLKNLNITKSPGPDLVHPKILYELADVIDTPLCMIYNESYEIGLVPENWRIGQISALFKKGDRKLASNYRPVSLTSIIGKTMEKLIRNKITEHMNTNNLFSDRQYGFIGGRSTALQLLTVLDIWTDALDHQEQIDAIYMDFMKAFDKVPHGRLVQKLKSYGISDRMCIWIKSFLTNRKQRVHINGNYSKWHNVASGIPQGSVLGPLLFVCFINDLPDSVLSSVYLFADDTKLFRAVSNKNDQDTLQNDVDNLFDWSTTWLLKFHPDKCKVLKVENKRSRPSSTSYQMNTYDGGRITLESVDCEKDVGVSIDSNLSFMKHISTQVNKANQMVGIIRRSFTHLDYRTFCILFKSLVRPHLEYANCTWSPYKKKDIDTIENVQRRATKMLPNMQDLSYPERLKSLRCLH
ncbi:hypothetical protein FSP39_013497 [Pinctada imbricata]|uniref:Reverse transcriptase domain-containing protein n=1 Tax=Pinctada imbricata TaxID=66713 RepID=A0AA89C1C4_PINIB|nr:hypothetical protein FSP39_013497 [Pinctada imbricata]